MQRREFLALPIAAIAAPPESPAAKIYDKICLFTDHLDDHFDVAEVARMVKELGLGGPDLTVRPGGVVKPGRAAEDLPRAAAVFKENGLTIPMITTAVRSAADPAAQALLKTAAALGIRYFKLGYYEYAELSRWRDTLQTTRREVQSLARLAKELGMRGGFHNHSGSLGGPLWDAWEVLDGADPAAIGHYFDPAQATIEGGRLAWRLGFQRSAPRLFMLAIKDFVWEKASGSRWRTRWVPLGEGMVDWPEFFRMLRQVNFPGPISLHIEYDPGGVTKTQRYDRSLEAAARDLKFLKQRIAEAYS